MALLQNNIVNKKQFVLNDFGREIKIKQINILDVNILYKIILANKIMKKYFYQS